LEYPQFATDHGVMAGASAGKSLVAGYTSGRIPVAE
jgi:hypothetical protein